MWSMLKCLFGYKNKHNNAIFDDLFNEYSGKVEGYIGFLKDFDGSPFQPSDEYLENGIRDELIFDGLELLKKKRGY